MITAVAIISCAVFVATLRWSGLFAICAGAATAMRGALDSLRDPNLDDDAREGVARAVSMQLFAASGSILARGAGVVLAALAPIVFADWLGLTTSGEVLVYLASWPTLLAFSLFAVVVYSLWERLWPSR